MYFVGRLTTVQIRYDGPIWPVTACTMVSQIRSTQVFADLILVSTPLFLAYEDAAPSKHGDELFELIFDVKGVPIL